MAEFDLLGSVLARRAGDQKIASVDSAAESKKGFLQTRSDEIRSVVPDTGKIRAYAPQDAAAVEANKGSVVSRLGLSPDSAEGTLVNWGTQVVSGVGKLAGYVTGAVPAAWGALNELPLRQEHLDAYARVKQGTQTETDLELLNSVITKPGAPIKGPRDTLGGSTPNELIDRSQNAYQVSKAAGDLFDWSGLVNKKSSDAMVAELKTGFDKPWEKLKAGADALKEGKLSGGAKDVAGGLGELLFNAVESGKNNPEAVIGFALENAPQLLVGAAGQAGRAAMTTSNIGYGFETYQKGLQEYAKTHNGQLPSIQERNQMAGWAAAAALLEQGGDVAELGLAKGMKGLAQLAKPAAAAAESAIHAIERKGLKEVLFGTIGAGAKGTLIEGVTEGAQTAMESLAQLKEVDPAEVYVGGTIGAFSGGLLTGSTRGVVEAGQGVASLASKTLAQAGQREAEKVALQDAVAKGDPSIFLDPTSPQYNPGKAIDVLQLASQKEGTTPEQKQAGFKQAMGVLGSVEQEEAKLYAQTPKGKAEFQEKLAALPDTPENADEKARLTELVGMQEAQGEQLSGVQKQRTVMARQIDDIYEKLGVFSQDLQRSQGPVKGDLVKAAMQEASVNVDPADTQAVQTSQAAATKVINLSMAAPGSVDPELLAQLANNTSNGLSQAQRAVLRQLSQAQVAANALKTGADVRKEIYFGDPAKNQLGIADYQRRFGLAMQAGSTDRAQKQVQGIGAFAADHSAKAAAAEKALAQAIEVRAQTGGTQGVKLLRTADGKWIIEPIAPGTDLEALKKELAQSGSLRIHPGSKPVVRSIKEEADALTQTRDAMGAAVALASQGLPPPQSPSPAAVTGSGPAVAVAPLAATPAPLPSVASVSSESLAAPSTPQEQKQEPVTGAEPAKVEQPQAAQTAEPVVATVEEAPKEETSGVLAVFKTKVDLAGKKLGTAFRGMNLVAAFLAQKDSRTEAGTSRPLVKTADFLSAWHADRKLAGKFLPTKLLEELKKLGNEDKTKVAAARALNHARETLMNWVPLVDKNMPLMEVFDKLNEDFGHRDMLRFLMTEQADGSFAVDENVLTAIAYSAYQWVLDEVNSPASKLPSEISEMHSRDESDRPTSAGMEVLSGLSAFEDTVVNSLGQAALQALGFTASKDAPKDLLPRLQSALGVHALALLQEQKLLSRETLLASKVNTEFFKNDPAITKKFKPDVTFTYVRFNREAMKAVEIKEANYLSRGVVDKLFGSEKAARFAGTEPAKFTQRFAKGTQQLISKAQRRVIQATQDTPHKVIPEMLQLALAMGRDALLVAAGAVDLNGPVHMVNQAAVKAQNDNIIRQYELMMEMLAIDPDNMLPEEVTKATGQEFFVTQNVWKNFRAGFETQSLNQQSSKLHRFMFSRPNWQAKIKLDDQKMVDEFKIAVAQALGVKTDQKPNAQTLASQAVKEMFESKSSKVHQAAQVIRQGLLAGDASVWTEANQALVAETAASNEGMMSLQGLMALAKFLHAQETGAKDFEVTLLVGADGKTNGPILTHLALGAASSVKNLFGLLNRGGMFSVDDEFDHFSQFAANKGKDLYQDLASVVFERLRAAGDPEYLAAFQVITKQLFDPVTGEIKSGGRNLMKTPLTAFAFGSALSKSVASMEQAFIDSVYKAIEDLAAGSRSDLQDPATLIDALNMLIGSEQLAPMSTDQLLAFRLSYRQESQLRSAFQVIMGDTVQETMEVHFATFIDRRRALNESISAGFSVYQAAYAAARQAYVNKLMDSGDIAFRVPTQGDNAGQRVALHDLTSAQEATLREQVKGFLPVMNTSYSKAEGSLDSGLFMGKTASELSSDPVYLSKVMLNSKFGTKGGKFLETKAAGQVEKAPGVAGTPYAIHSSDSAIMHAALEAFNEGMGLNVHDEISTGVHQIAGAAGAINQATVETFLNYSPAAEARDMLGRQLIAVADQLRQGKLPAYTVRVMFEAWADMHNRNQRLKEDRLTPAQVAGWYPSMAAWNAFEADRLRLGALASMKSMDQYTWEGGQFTVTEELRAQAQKQLEALTDAVAPDVEEALKYLEGVLATPEAQRAAPAVEADTEIDASPKVKSPVVLGVPGVVGSTVMGAQKLALDPKKPIVPQINKLPDRERVPMIETVAVAAAALPPSKKSPWGELGSNNPARHSEALVAFLASRGTVTAKEIYPVLKQMLESNANNQGMVALLNRVVNLMGNDFSIMYVTPSTAPEAVIAAPVFDGSRGWYVAEIGNRRQAYILSPDFKHSAVHAEVVLHEMLHGLLARIIEEPNTPEAKQLVAELQDLLEQVRKDPVAKQFGNATADVHELVSWGLTNRKFQTEVLAKVQVKEHKSKDNRLVTAMQSFIKTMRAFFFKNLDTKAKDKATNGLTILLSNVSGLFAAVAEESNSDGVAVNLSQQAPNPLTTEEIFDSLASSPAASVKSLTPEFQSHLKGLLQEIVIRLQGPKTQVSSALFVSGITPHLRVTDQEAFVIEQVEATLRAVIGDETQVGAVYAELSKLYKEAYRRLTPADFPSQELYDFIFKVEQGANGRSDYLTRFAALGLGHQEIRQVLQLGTELVRPAQAPRSFADRLVKMFQKTMAWLSGRLAKTVPGEAMNARLQKLAGQLVEIEAKKRLKSLTNTPLDKFLDVGTDMAKSLKSGAKKVVESSIVKDSRINLVRFAGSATGVFLKENGEKVIDAALALRDTAVKNRQGMVAGLVNSLRGPNEIFQFLLRNLKKLEKDRQHVISDVSKAVRDAYRDGGARLDNAKKAAVSAVFLRSGLHALLDVGNGGLDMAGIQQLLEDPAALEAAIRQRLGVLGAEPATVHYYQIQAKALAYFRVTGIQRSQLGMLNAGNIARLYGTQYSGKVTEAVAVQAEKQIDELASLYAVQYSSVANLAQAKDILREEMARTDGGNGVEVTLRIHKKLELESRERLFGGHEALMMKGYTAEIYNPNTGLAVARTPEEVQALKEQGFVESAKLSLDPNDPNQAQPKLFVLKDGGQMPYLTGAMSLTGMAAKGSVRYGGMSNAFDEGVENTAQADALSHLRAQQAQRMFSPQPSWDPRSVGDTFMTPVMSPDGRVSGWRYMMQEKTKDMALDRDSRVDEVLGAMAGSIFDKSTSSQHNTDVVQALHDLYRMEYRNRPDSFVRISHDSKNPEMREMYRLLPDRTQAEIRDVWGPNGMMVPYELLDVVFGYRKLSLSKSFDKKAALRKAALYGYSPSSKDSMNKIEDAFVRGAEGVFYNYARSIKMMSPSDAHTFSRTAGTWVRRGERATQEIVREVKDTIVVRGLKTMLGNIKSNMTLMLMWGVSPWELAHHHWVALKGATDYQRDRSALAQLKLQLESGYTRGDEDRIQREIVLLEDSLARNPVRELIDAGLMPTIVEDVGEDDDIYSYKAAFTKKIDGLTAGFNPKVKEVGKWLYMTHDTPVYQSLSRITQLSDFVARYTLYQHVTSRKDQPLSKADAIQLASDSFVNYDIPMHRNLQYLDDMGITMFTKYFLYIQRVLLKMGKERPVQMLMAAALHQYYGRLDLVTESSMVYRIGNNPLNSGPFEALEGAQELPIMQLLF